MLRINCGCSWPWPAVCSGSRLCHTRVTSTALGSAPTGTWGCEGTAIWGTGRAQWHFKLFSALILGNTRALIRKRRTKRRGAKAEEDVCELLTRSLPSTLLPGPAPQESRAASSFLPCQTSYLLPCEITGWGIWMRPTIIWCQNFTWIWHSLTWKEEL